MSDISKGLSELAGILAKLQAMANQPSQANAASAAINRLNSPLGPEWINHDAFTVEEAGKILGLSRCSAFAAAARGDIPTIRLGRRLIVPRRGLEKMLAGEVQA
jgi:hypothetical protein